MVDCQRHWLRNQREENCSFSVSTPALFTASNRVITLQGFLGSDNKFWLEELHHPLPGQQGPREAAGAAEGAHPVRRQDRGQTAQL